MHIAVLLATYNGETYLQEQLDSIVAQTHRNWTLWASDDGSQDGTVSILDAFSRRAEVGRAHLIHGPQKGFIANFLSCVCNPNIRADAYAYSDQDDIWFVDKLERAIKFLVTIPVNQPALYCSRTLYVDAQNNPLGLSLPYRKPAHFANALIQNIASGNTMVFNDAARKFLIQAGSQVDIDLHDWWTYMLVTGMGGTVLFDQTPSVRYRQHPHNLWGMNTSFKSQWMRIQKLFGGRFANWNERHVAALVPMQHLLTLNNQRIFEQFATARKLSLVPRLVGLKKSGVYRQTMITNMGFFLAAIAGKI
jgi:glycosyltransferase involved in cell wall biosynthesis